MLRLIALGATILTLTACAGLDDKACRAGDWQGLGLADGMRGRDADFIQNYLGDCADLGIVIDPAAYETGRTTGLRIYCTPLAAYLEGRKGRVLKDICPVPRRDAITAQNRRGLAAKLALDEARKRRPGIAVTLTPVGPGLLSLPAPILDLGGGRTERDALAPLLRDVRRDALLVL